MIKQKSIEVKEIHTFTCDTEDEKDNKISEMESLNQGWNVKTCLILDTESENEEEHSHCFQLEFSIVRQRQDFM